METAHPLAGLPLPNLQTLRTPGCDGSLKVYQILKTDTLADDVVDAPEHLATLRDGGINLEIEGPAIRLLNDYDGSARWTTFISFKQALPLPKVHPAYECKLDDLMSRTSLAKERQSITELWEQYLANDRPGNMVLSPTYHTLASMQYFAKLGSAAWRYFPKFVRDSYRDLWLRVGSAPGCPPNLERLIFKCLSELLSCPSFADKSNVAENSSRDLIFHDNFRKFADNVINELTAAVMSGMTVYNDSRAALLHNVRQILNAEAGTQCKIAVLSRATILWPNEHFKATTRSLKDFLEDHNDRLKSLRSASEEEEEVEEKENHSDDATEPGQTGLATRAGNRNSMELTSTADELDESLDTYVPPFNNLTEGYNHFYRPRRTLDLEGADDWQYIHSKSFDYVRKISKAMKTQPENETDEQSKMKKAFDSKLQEVRNPDKYLSSVGAMVVKAVLDLHIKGDHYFPGQIRIGAHDRSLKATERMTAILDVLKNTKRVCADLLQGHDAITRFVASPLMHQKRKLANIQVNKKKAGEIAEGRAAKKRLQSDDQEDDLGSESDTEEPSSVQHRLDLSDAEEDETPTRPQRKKQKA